MDYFFYVEKDLPAGVGIDLYGIEHKIWLFLSIAMFFGICFLAARLKEREFSKLKWILCISILFSELMRDFMMFGSGYPLVEVLPLHMCGLAVFVILWHRLTGSKLAAELLYCLGMPGAICALLFPNWLNYPVLSLLSINSIIGHTIIALYPMVLLASGELRPRARRLPRCLFCLIIVMIPIYVFNKLTGMNYFFLNWPSPGSPLEIFGRYWGNPGYILGCFPLLGTIWFALYSPIVILGKVKARKAFE